MSWSVIAPVGGILRVSLSPCGVPPVSGTPSWAGGVRRVGAGVGVRGGRGLESRRGRGLVGLRAEGGESGSTADGGSERDRYSKFSLHVAEVGCYITSMDDGTYSMKFLLPNTDVVIKSVSAKQLAALHPIKAEDQGEGEAAEAVKNLAVPKAKKSSAGTGSAAKELTTSPEAAVTSGGMQPADEVSSSGVSRPAGLPPKGEYRTVESTEELDEVLKANRDGITVLEVGMTWCRPCMGFEPKYKRATRENEDMVFLRINGNVSEDTKFLCKHLLKVRATPSFYFFHKRGMISSHSGANEGRLKAAILQASELLSSNELSPAEPLLDNYEKKMADEQHRAAEEAALASMKGRQGD